MSNKKFNMIGGKKGWKRIPEGAGIVPSTIPKKPENKSSDLENKTKSQIIPIAGDLAMITDENMYNEAVKFLDKTFPNHREVLTGNLKFEDGVMKGSNPYIHVAVDKYLKEINSEYRVSIQKDLESNLDFTRGTYNDSGLALRNLTGSNKEQAKYLFDQLKKRGVSENDFPIWIDLRGLDLDKNSLNFKLTDESQFYKNQDFLNWDSGTNFSETNKYGFPKKPDENGSRTLWTSDNALSRCYLNVDSDLVSYYSGLSISYDDGRVVVAKPRAP